VCERVRARKARNKINYIYKLRSAKNVLVSWPLDISFVITLDEWYDIVKMNYNKS